MDRAPFSSLSDEYARLWDTATTNPSKVQTIDEAAAKLRGFKSSYEPVSRETGVPWFVIGLIHNLESSFSFQQHLHNGNPLGSPTVDEPRGRPLSPPFDWPHSAVDALTMKGLQHVEAWTIERIAYELEGYNGWGYRTRQIPSPYLWSFTNHYVRGKFVRDHFFDPDFVSDQVGAMALLKRLAGTDLTIDGLALRRQGRVAAPPPPPAPVETGRYQPDGRPFILRDAEDAEAKEDDLLVMPDMSMEKIAGDETSVWWKVLVELPDSSKSEGFAKREWIRPVLARQDVTGREFAQSCLDAARLHGTSAHFLIALADAETGLTSKPAKSGAFGPFAMTRDDWAASKPTETGDGARFNPYAQAAVVAPLIAQLTESLRMQLADRALPTSEQLYLARIVGPPAVKALLGAKPETSVGEVLQAAIQKKEDLDRLLELRPSLMTKAMTVEQLRGAVTARLDAGFKKAVDLVLQAEPDLVVGPAQAADGANTPWMEIARAELAKKIAELPGRPSNPEIEKYFTATTLGRQPDDTSWCAAFVSWCIKQAGGSRRPANFSARAADWLANGESLSGPRYGAIAVTKPYSPQSSGHVGFVAAWDGTRVNLLGGNQDDRVCQKDFPIADVRGWRMM
jgi:uncharacterized protein (TIGR02594 family)